MDLEICPSHSPSGSWRLEKTTKIYFSLIVRVGEIPSASRGESIKNVYSKEELVLRYLKYIFCHSFQHAMILIISSFSYFYEKRK